MQRSCGVHPPQPYIVVPGHGPQRCTGIHRMLQGARARQGMDVPFLRGSLFS